MAAPVASSGPSDRRERIVDAIVRVGKAYWYVVTIFIGAMVAAILAGYIAGFVPLPKAGTAQRIRDIAWIAGALVVAIGTPLGWVRVSMPGVSYRKNPPAEEDSSPPPAPGPPDRSAAFALRSGLFMALAGAFVGLVVGGTLAIVWLSISMGPLAPVEWLRSITFRADSAGTSNPIPVALWFGTIAAFGALGFVFGLVGARMGWVTSSSSKPNRARR